VVANALSASLSCPLNWSRVDESGIACDRVEGHSWSSWTIDAEVHEWYEFLCAHHDAVLGWVGGTQRIEGTTPSGEAVRDRLLRIRQALDLLFGHRRSFRARWTYTTGVKV
jgi:hypothetical protein